MKKITIVFLMVLGVLFGEGLLAYGMAALYTATNIAGYQVLISIMGMLLMIIFGIYVIVLIIEYIDKTESR